MSADSENVWIAFNGEIYNFLELKEELKSRGHSFKTNSDTEVVLASYLEWGTECFKRFNGMWGLSIYDRRVDQIILSRDRFGKKPLHYYYDETVLIFASEIKSLFLHPSVPKKMNMAKIIDYAGRHYRYVDIDNDTYFLNIHQVPKSSFMVFNIKGLNEVCAYWNLSIPKSFDILTDSEMIEEFRYLFHDAVKIRLRSDVPVGCMLSGGLDSGSITCLAAQENKKIHTFSGVTGDGYFDESEYINEIVKHEEVQHIYIYQNHSNLYAILKEMLQFHDEPVCTVTWLCNYILSKEVAKNKIPVILTGHGGDELLAGYWDHYHYAFADLRGTREGDNLELKAWLDNHKRGLDEYTAAKKYINSLKIETNLELEKYSPYLNCLQKNVLKFSKCGNINGIDTQKENQNLLRRLYMELFFETIPPSLRAEDRNMMAFAIENRLPLLDYRLVEFCFKLSNSAKIRNGLGKWLLRESMKGILPEKVRLRKDKTGFNAPFGDWIRNELRQMMQQMISKKSFMNTEIYDQKNVQKKFEEHLSGSNYYMFFWQYLNLNIWHELFFE